MNNPNEVVNKIELPIKPSVEVMKMLIKAKYFLNHAIGHSEKNNDFDLMISLHSLDNSIEYLLRIIIRHLDIEEKTGRTINTAELAALFGEVDKFLKEKTIKDNVPVRLSFELEIKKIRELRNNVQHGIILPITEIQTFLDYGIRFYDRTLKKIFGINYGEVNYSTLITDAHIKQLLLDAENKIGEGKYLESIVSCRDAFDYAYFVFHQHTSQNIAKAPALTELKNTSINLYYYVQEIDRKLQMTSLKVDISKYEHYHDYISHIPKEYCAHWNGNAVMQREWNKNDTDFCYTFVSEAILMWQLNKNERLYEVDLSDIDNRVWIESFNEFIIPSEFKDYHCRYINDTGDNAYLFYVGESDINSIMEIKKDEVYTYKSQYFYKGELKNITTMKVIISAIDINFIMNQPVIWEVIICYKEI